MAARISLKVKTPSNLAAKRKEAVLKIAVLEEAKKRIAKLMAFKGKDVAEGERCAQNGMNYRAREVLQAMRQEIEKGARL